MNTDPNSTPIPSRDGAWRMFDRIARYYDPLNRILSLGRDVAWRRHLAEALDDRTYRRILDVATGTGDVLLALARVRRTIELGVGCDMAGEMLRIGRRKIRRRCLYDTLLMVRGNAERLGFSDESFDAVTIAFGIRNVANLETALREMCRVLRPGGALIVLEFSLPANRAVRAAYLVYFRHVLPAAGSLLSADGDAYRYLNRTVETFPYGEALCARIRAAGFVGVRSRPLTLGIATLYQGEKACSQEA